MKRVLLLWKPTLQIRESRCVGVQDRMLGMVRVDWGALEAVSTGWVGERPVWRRCMAAAVTVSLVWEESMRAVRVW